MSSLERSAERFLGVVSDSVCDCGDAQIGGGEQILGHVHAPVGEIADR
jgi:hypothetical protein